MKALFLSHLLPPVLSCPYSPLLPPQGPEGSTSTSYTTAALSLLHAFPSAQFSSDATLVRTLWP